MKWWSRLPLASIVLLAGVVAIINLRDQAGTQAGYLMAGSCLTLAGIFATLEVLRYRDEKKDDDDEKDGKEEDHEE